MNGVHDMGGMQGMGPIEPESESDAPVFHAPWEGRVFALRRAMGAWGKWNIDAMRHGIEKLPAADYLNYGYFGRQFLGFVELLIASGLVTRAEIDSGSPARDAGRLRPALSAAGAAALIAQGKPAGRTVPAAPRATVGQAMRTRNIHPAGHTRLPRYARGKQGVVVRDHGVFVFPDSNAYFLGENPQHLYSVRFAARELWGEAASPRDSVHLDLWDAYLEPV